MAFSNRTFGVEFEFFIPANSFKVIEKKFPDIKVTWSTDSFSDGGNYVTNAYGVIKKLLNKIGLSSWKIHEDSSISPSGPGSFYAVPVEVVSPILQGSDGIAQVKKFCDFFGTIGKVNKSCGTHVHVGAPDFKERGKTAERLTLALIHYKSVEKIFDSLVAASRRGNKNEFAAAIESESQTLTRYKALIQNDAKHLNDILEYLGEDRYSKLNIQALAKHGTLEFRQMHGTLNAQLITNWIKIVTSFVDMVIKTEGHFADMFSQIVEKKKSQDMNAEEAKRFVSKAPLIPIFKNNFLYAIDLAEESELIKYNELSVYWMREFLRPPKINFLGLQKNILELNVTMGDEHSKNISKGAQKYKNQLLSISSELEKLFKDNLKPYGCISCQFIPNSNFSFNVSFILNDFIKNISNFAKTRGYNFQKNNTIPKQQVDAFKQKVSSVNPEKRLPKTPIKTIQNLKEEIALLKNLT